MDAQTGHNNSALFSHFCPRRLIVFKPFETAILSSRLTNNNDINDNESLVSLRLFDEFGESYMFDNTIIHNVPVMLYGKDYHVALSKPILYHSTWQ